ncbi:hypothetical protein KUCAC02_032624 [Chaenocephalus aceratus]|nr:hypothetical protein KUCAC02_033377 [Chaenocephalus aceratus]KAI4793581.1 hypothetical protein KUCAC02_032624 [Chaenocephalus aceratus]
MRTPRARDSLFPNITKMEPRFRKRDGIVSLSDTLEATKVKKSNKDRPWIRPLSLEEVMDKARTAITQHRGDPSNRRHLLGFFEIQFGLFRGQTFRWVVENSLGYAAYLVAAMKRDPTGGCKDSKEHALSKGMFKEYIELFPSGRIAIAMKEEQYAANAPQHTPPAQVTPPAQHLTTTEHAALTQQSGTSQHASTSSLRSLLVGQNVPNQRSLTNAVKRLVSPSKTKPSLVHARARPTPHLIQLPVSFEAAKAPASALTHPAVSSEVNDSTLLAEAVQFEEENPAAGWTHTLPEVDQRWISKALFKWNAKGHPELDSRVDKLWWYPPQVPLRTSKSPAQENYFGHPLLLWMPRKLWQVMLTCPHPDCNKDPLTSAGLHQKIRQVVAVGKIYFVASEYLACPRCKRKVISWSHGLISQLDIGHRVQFPCILTSKLACDFEVASLMRQRGLGNSSSQIQRKLQERHAEVWMQKTVQYL